MKIAFVDEVLRPAIANHRNNPTANHLDADRLVERNVVEHLEHLRQR
jgi:hypothetical protein